MSAISAHLTLAGNTPEHVGGLLLQLEREPRASVLVGKQVSPELYSYVTTLEDATGSLGHMENAMFISHVHRTGQLHQESPPGSMQKFFEKCAQLEETHGEYTPSYWAALGVSVCGVTAEDSVCCEDPKCERCSDFKCIASEYGIYEV